MPHVAITMLPGRSKKIKESLAAKIQSLVAQELKIDKKIVSVSIEDIPLENWNESMEKIKLQNIIIKPQD